METAKGLVLVTGLLFSLSSASLSQEPRPEDPRAAQVPSAGTSGTALERAPLPPGTSLPPPAPVPGAAAANPSRGTPPTTGAAATGAAATIQPNLFAGSTQPPALPAAAPTAGATQTSLSPESFSLGAEPAMIGDMSPILSLRSIRTSALPPTPPPLPSPGQASSFVASVRGLKISENQSPRPQDRFFYTFNYFAEVNQHLNKVLEASVAGLRVYREVLGFEKTYNEGNGSFGIRMPINTVSANSTSLGNFAKLAGTSTAMGDLSLFTKHIFVRDPATGSMITGGLALTVPTGPDQFAGAKYLAGLHSTEIQPFVGYIWKRDRFYLHGFTAIDTPSTLRQATLVYNDVGVGYFILRRPDPDYWLTSVAPTFEVHVNSPLTHGDPYNRLDPGGVPNVVNLTYGINFEFTRRSVLTLGMATPVTGPRPFDYEAMILFNVYFGRTRRTMQSNLPMIGG
jgi:hypothetical protein